MPTRTPFGKKIRELRNARKLSQAAASDAIGIARGTLASIETGSDLPGRDTMFAIATFYGIGMKELWDQGLTTVGPGASQIVDDPDELALLALWRSLTTEERGLMLRLLAPDSRAAA